MIPPQDFDELREAGAAAIFPPGTVIADAAAELLEQLAAASPATQAARDRYLAGARSLASMTREAR